jgi:hypothetical protein
MRMGNPTAAATFLHTVFQQPLAGRAPLKRGAEAPCAFLPVEPIQHRARSKQRCTNAAVNSARLVLLYAGQVVI